MIMEEILNLCQKRGVEIYTRYDFITDTLIIKMRKGHFAVERTILADEITRSESAGFGLTARIILCSMADELEREAGRMCEHLIQEDEALQECTKPTPEERTDCLMCGGKATVVGRRTRSNGHFHGQCGKCGAWVLE